MEPQQSFPDMSPRVVLGIAAHPDDLDFGAAGTLAAYAAQGAAVYYLQLTDGGKGSNDPQITSEELVNTRKAEQQSACQAIGGRDVFFLNHPDGELEVTLALKKEIVRFIRKLQPDLVITTDPTMVYHREWGLINHSDHRAAGQAVLDAVYPLARDRLAYPDLLEEGLLPHKVKTVLLTAFSDQNFFVDVTSVMDQKMAAISAHASQLHDADRFTDMLVDMAVQNGKKAGVQYAEGFVRLEIMS
jgi:LmbE family N-acetylglucosaminyl deacetylase